MNTQDPEIIVATPNIHEKIRETFKAYVESVLRVVADDHLKKELFKPENNKKRIDFLNDIPNLKIPDGVQVIFKTGGLTAPCLTVKSKERTYRIVDGAEVFKLIEVLSEVESKTREFEVTTEEKITVKMHDDFSLSEITLEMPFIDPAEDHTLCEIKYSDQEIVLTTMAG